MPKRDELKQLENEVARIAASTLYNGERAIVLQFVVEKERSFDPAVAGRSRLWASGKLPKKDAL